MTPFDTLTQGRTLAYYNLGCSFQPSIAASINRLFIHNAGTSFFLSTREPSEIPLFWILWDLPNEAPNGKQEKSGLWSASILSIRTRTFFHPLQTRSSPRVLPSFAKGLPPFNRLLFFGEAPILTGILPSLTSE